MCEVKRSRSAGVISSRLTIDLQLYVRPVEARSIHSPCFRFTNLVSGQLIAAHRGTLNTIGSISEEAVNATALYPPDWAFPYVMRGNVLGNPLSNAQLLHVSVFSISESEIIDYDVGLHRISASAHTVVYNLSSSIRWDSLVLADQRTFIAL